MTFCYISGTGADSTEKGRLIRARIKGKTENDQMKLPLQSIYTFRSGFLNPSKGSRNVHINYVVIRLRYPSYHCLLPKYVLTLKELGWQ